MADYTHLRRRTFLIAAAAGGTLAAHAVVKPEDPRYVSLKEAHKGTPEIDLRIMNQFGDQPQEVQDFYMACRTALAGENPEAGLADVCRKYTRRTLGGPMLGDVSSTGVSVWMHLPEPAAVEVIVKPEAGGAAQVFKSEGAARIHSVRCSGLAPDTAYTYSVKTSGTVLGKGCFVTAPAELSENPFRIAFGSCFHKVGIYRPELMRLVRERGCRAMLVIGDAAADDRENDFALIKTDYLLRNLSPPWRQLTAAVPVYASWDDHDYFNNDRSGTYTPGGKAIQVEALRGIWKAQWNNPERETARAGIYYQTKIGPVHYISLDTRSCRMNDRRGELNSYLGAEQTAWLKKQIRESAAPFILISSGTMWSDYISAGKDSWGTWDTEGREEIFKLIDEKKDARIILLSGDRHGARGFAIPRPNGRKIYEFEAASLGGVPGPGAFGKGKEHQLFGYPGRTWAVGELSFSTGGDGPKAVFRLIDVNGNEMETVEVQG